MQINKILSRRVVTEAGKYIFSGRTSFGPLLIDKREFNVNVYQAMAQTSITSFFKFTPLKSTVKNDECSVKEEKSPTTSTVNDISPTISDKKEKRLSKRPRLESSESESEALNRSKSSPTVSSEKKKKIKRPRIDSSDSESEQSKPKLSIPKHESKSSPESDVEPSPKCTNTPPDEKPKIKLEKTDSPNTYASPKSKKGKPKVLKETNKSKKQEKTTPKSKTASSTNSPTWTPSPTSNRVKKDVDSQQKSIEESNDVNSENSDTVPVPETEYNPAKAKYHPIKDACWARGKPVPYLALAKTFEAIEPISARLKIIEILSNYFRSVLVLTPEDLLANVYMCLNQLAPAYHSLELGIAETYLMKAVGVCTGRSLAAMRAAQRGRGDLGAVAEAARRDQRTMFPQPPLTARHVFATFKQIAHMTGQASVNKKIAKIQSLYVASRHSEARYLIRSLEGKLRIGLAEQSVLQALALATATTPPSPSGTHVLDASEGLSAEKFKSLVDEHSIIIKTTYCECPNYDAIVPVILEHGVRALPDHCKLTVGVPLKPMLAHPTKGVHEVFNRFEGSQFTCEWKYDGERAQIHVPAERARAAVFSRNQENNTSKYPDIIRRLPSLLKESVTDCVLDCEAVAYDTVNKEILPFQILSTRKRKDATEADIKVQVCVFVFDLLFLNGAPLVREPLARRRRLLRDHFRQVEGEWQFATSKDCKDMEEVQLFLEEAVKGSCEGLMVKTLEGDHAKYDIARRSHNWLKLKKDYLDGVGDTIDVVIIGAYHGRGKRRAGYGGFLAACRDPDTDTYQALCKLGTGFSDEDLVNLTAALQQHEIPQPRSYYSYDSSHAPDAWFSAALVWEVRCADLSLSPAHRAAIGLVDPDKGISLRFPRFVRAREDKTPEQATHAQQIAQMYLAQDQLKNASAKPAYNMDDFY